MLDLCLQLWVIHSGSVYTVVDGTYIYIYIYTLILNIIQSLRMIHKYQTTELEIFQLRNLGKFIPQFLFAVVYTNNSCS